MNGAAVVKLVGMVLGIVLAGLVVASLLDILIAVLRSRFYTEVAFVVTFVVAGIFATSAAYINITDKPAYKSAAAHYLTLGVLVVCGLIFFFLLAGLEGGEYKVPFKGYGASLALSSLLFLQREKRQKKKAP